MPKLIPALFTLATLWWVKAPLLQAETMYAVSYEAANTPTIPNLFRFDSAAPGAITTPQPITGLGSGESLFDIAIRPVDGQLYGLGSLGSVYRINPTTATATLIVSNSVFSSLLGTMAFNPVTDQLRVITLIGPEDSRSFRVNVSTGAVLQDGYSAGQPSGLAYTNNYAGATTTTLHALFGDQLTIDNPEDQSLFNLATQLEVPVGMNAASDLSLSGVTGTAYESLAYGTGTPGPYSSQLYTVNLSTGAETLVGPIGNGTLYVAYIAAPVGPAQVAPVPEPASWELLGAGLLLSGTFWRFRLRPAQKK